MRQLVPSSYWNWPLEGLALLLLTLSASTLCPSPLSPHSWVGFEHHDFQGQQFVLERGEYPNWEAFSGSLSHHIERFMSLRPIYCAVSTGRWKKKNNRQETLDWSELSSSVSDPLVSPEQPHSDLWEGELPGPQHRAERRLPLSAGHGLAQATGGLHAGAVRSVSDFIFHRIYIRLIKPRTITLFIWQKIWTLIWHMN